MSGLMAANGKQLAAVIPGVICLTAADDAG